jgi:hypothetical protein
MRRFLRYLDAFAGLNCPGWLTLYGKFEAAFQNVGRFDPRMSRPPDCHAGAKDIVARWKVQPQVT